MKKVCVLMLAGLIGVAAQAVLIDDFSGDLSAYTNTVILDNNGGASNVSSWQIADGVLQISTTVYDGIEQHAFIRSGLSLGIGHELQADVVVGATGTQDIGLYVGGTTPQTGVRKDYIAMYRRNNGQLFSRGFDGTTEYALAGDWTHNIPIDTLFIARIAENTYEAGWYYQGTRTVLATRTPAYANAGTVVGFYADVRGAGVVGSLDNLRILVPEPATMGLLGLGAFLAARKRK
ncbi:MAG TPA: PEP-CTERM sorting domain-containing protein [Anaerohalosphaeraceae bacterium]|nr:PEP-CTERM sorting domain-containing protein [Anaerohalosphaeraceae bacterium]